jgi:hypothetical protein
MMSREQRVDYEILICILKADEVDGFFDDASFHIAAP